MSTPRTWTLLGEYGCSTVLGSQLGPFHRVEVVELEPVLDLLELFVASDDCRLDHHGYCQQHSWLDTSRCYQATLKDLPREHGRLQ